MKIESTKLLTIQQTKQIDKLWNEEFPVQLNNRFPLLLEGVENYNHYLIKNEQNEVIAWAVDFEKDKEKRFSIIVSEKQKGKGYGTHLVKKLKEELPEFYGWVIDHDNDKKSNGVGYRSPLDFYLKHGFEVLHDKRIDNDMLKAVKIKWSTK